MMKTTETTSKDVDAILYVHDGHGGLTDEDIGLAKKYYGLGIPMIIAYTKIDIMPAERIPADAKALAEAGIEADFYPVSARRGKNIKALEKGIFGLLPEGDKLFSEDVVSDKSEKFMIAELMREKILLKFDEEIPHGVAILIGKQGRAIKEVSSFARQDMEKFLGAKVFLTTYVKVREDWRDSTALMKELGYGGEE